VEKTKMKNFRKHLDFDFRGGWFGMFWTGFLGFLLGVLFYVNFYLLIELL